MIQTRRILRRGIQVIGSLAAWAFLAIALVLTGLLNSTCAAGADPITTRRTLAESAGDPPRACTAPNCAMVIAVKQQDMYESPPLFGPYRITPQSRFQVQKTKEVWVVEVRRRDGTVQSVKLNYPALFQVGDWVLVEGDQLWAPE